MTVKVNNYFPIACEHSTLSPRSAKTINIVTREASLDVSQYSAKSDKCFQFEFLTLISPQVRNFRSRAESDKVYAFPAWEE